MKIQIPEATNTLLDYSFENPLWREYNHWKNSNRDSEWPWGLKWFLSCDDLLEQFLLAFSYCHRRIGAILFSYDIVLEFWKDNVYWRPYCALWVCTDFCFVSKTVKYGKIFSYLKSTSGLINEGKKVEKINPLLGKIDEKHSVNYSKCSKIKKWKK